MNTKDRGECESGSPFLVPRCSWVPAFAGMTGAGARHEKGRRFHTGLFGSLNFKPYPQ
jgi:hypothetical protein